VVLSADSRGKEREITAIVRKRKRPINKPVGKGRTASPPPLIKNWEKEERGKVFDDRKKRQVPRFAAMLWGEGKIL